MTLDEKILDKYPGVYQISPAFKLTVTREGQRLFIQGTNQAKAEVFAEAEGKFFARIVNAQFEFHVEGEPRHIVDAVPERPADSGEARGGVTDKTRSPSA